MAVYVLGGVAILLGVDEAGSLHERFDLLVPPAWGLSFTTFAAMMAVPIFASILVLFRRRKTLGYSWAMVLGAYVLFASVFGQEMLEHAIDMPASVLPLRTVVEEGTELAGFFFLLLAAVHLGRRSRVTPEGDRELAPFELVVPTYGPLRIAFVIAALVAPLLIFWSVTIPFEELRIYHRGNFGSTLMKAMFLIAGAICLRRALGDAPVQKAWLWVAMICILLSLLQNWHAYSDVQLALNWEQSLPLWRACYDLVWALPVLIVVTFLARRQIGMGLGMSIALVFVWIVCLVAAQRATYKMSYASSYLAAILVGGWVIYAPCRKRAAAKPPVESLT
mgnify:CR=1 FL=1